MDVLLIALPVSVLLLLILGRIAFIPNGVSFEDLLARTDLAWPRGVQEEEPVRWHVERLRPHAK